MVNRKRRTPATPRSTRRMLLRMIAPTSARLICREMTATLSCGRCTNGKKDSAYASTKLTASAPVEPCAVPGSDGRERGRIRLTMHYHEGSSWR